MDPRFVLAFDRPQAGFDYRRRPGAYGIARRGAEILLVESEGGLDIPGGGLEPGEDDGTALAREFIEETGYRVERAAPLVCLRQFLTKPEAGKFFDKYSAFYLVEIAGPLGPPTEAGNLPVWLHPEAALGRMNEACQDWLLRHMVIAANL